VASLRDKECSINPPHDVEPVDLEGQVNSPTVENEKEKQSDQGETPKLSLWMAIVTLLIVTVVSHHSPVEYVTFTEADQFVAVTAEFLVDSIDEFVNFYNIGEEWVALILLPIVGNAAGESHFRWHIGLSISSCQNMLLP